MLGLILAISLLVSDTPPTEHKDMVATVTWRHPVEVLNASATTGVPAAAIEAIMQTEGSGDTATSPAGAMGPMQVMPFHFQAGGVAAGLNPWNIQDNITAGALVLRNAFRGTGDWATAAGRYFGVGTDAGGMTTGGYIQRFTSFLAQLGGINAQPTGTQGGGGVTDVPAPVQTNPPLDTGAGTQTQTPVQTTVTGGANAPPTGFNLGLADSIAHIGLQFLLVIIAIALLLGGIYLLGSRK